MYHVFFAHIIHAEREREIEAAIRRRQLLQPPDETSEPGEARERRTSDARTLTAPARPTGG